MTSRSTACAAFLTMLTASATLSAQSRPPATQPAGVADPVWRTRHTLYGTLDRRIRECSGIVASRRHPGIYWALSDSGNTADLFAIHDTGDAVGVWTVEGVRNVDWEAIAIDDHGRILIGDIGDNECKRRDTRLLIVAEPAQPEASGRLPVQDAIDVRYPEGPRNAEALFACGGELLVIEKSLGLFGSAAAILYSVKSIGPATQQSAADNQPSPSLRALEKFTFAGPVTAADQSRDGRRLAVSTYTSLYVFKRPDAAGRFLTESPFVMPMLCGQVEGIAFHHDGSGDILLTNEQRSVYRVPRRWYESERAYVPGAILKNTAEQR